MQRGRSVSTVILIGVILVAALAAAALAVNIRALAAGSGGGTTPTVTLASAGPPNTLTVVGQGTATATPDQATLTLGASATRGNVHDALAADNADISHLLSALHGQGVLDGDIQTQSVSVNQVTQCCPQTVIGYAASNQVTVTVHHLANVGSVIAAVVDAVGNDVILNGVNLKAASPSDAIKSARAAAMSDAAARAADWALASKRTLGKLLSLSEVVSQSGGQPICNGGCGGGGVSISPGQTQIVVSVTATYELSS